MRLVDDPICPACDLEEETSAHILADCPVYVNARIRYFGSGFIDPSELYKLKWSKLLDFVQKIGLEI